MNKFRHLLISLFLAVLLSSTVVSAADTHFDVLSVESITDEDSLLLNANISLQLGDKVLDALDNGVAITLRFTIDIKRIRSNIWDENILTLTQRYRIKLHPLTNRILVVNINTGLSDDYADLNSALYALSSLRNHPLTSIRFLDAQEKHIGYFEIDIDIEALPPPMRPLAYFDNNWNASSNEFQWAIKP